MRNIGYKFLFNVKCILNLTHHFADRMVKVSEISGGSI